MRRLIASSAVALVAAAASILGPNPGAARADTPPGQTKDGHYSFAVIGDVPYGDAQIAAFPAWIDQINSADPAMTFHVGDIKNGSSRCDDAYYTLIRADFDRFVNPLIYTPGDNEWTDCHRGNNGGAYNPFERLACDRSVFFSQPGTTLGRTRPGSTPRRSPASRRTSSCAATESTSPWSTSSAARTAGSRGPASEPTATPEQVARSRRDGPPSPSSATPSRRPANGTTGRSVLLQADMFDPTYTPTTPRHLPPSHRSSRRSSTKRRLRRPGLPGQRRQPHRQQRPPLAAGSGGSTTYGVTGSADNLERITVDGSNNNKDWLHVTVNRPGAATAVSWRARIPYAPQAHPETPCNAARSTDARSVLLTPG